MKKILILAAVAMFMFSSCQKEEVTPGQNSQSEELVFTATIDQNSTKTTINTTDGKIKWAAGDEITITDGKTSVAYVAKSSGASVSFTKKEGEEGSLASGSTYSATYKAAPSTSQAYDDYYSDDNQAKDLYMTAPETNETTLTFTAACGLLKLTLTAATDASDKSIREIKVFGKVNSSDVIYTLTCSSAQDITSAKDFYIALPAGDYSVFKFTNNTGHICYKTAKEAMVIANNEIHLLPLTGIVFNDMLPGKFTVASGSQVRFSKGNLQATCTTAGAEGISTYSWAFAENQYDYVGNAAGNTSISTQTKDSKVDLFGWVGSEDGTLNGVATKYGISNSTTASDYGTSKTELKSDWGNTIDNNVTWRTLSSDEWSYLLNTRSGNNFAKAFVSKKKGLIIFPDGYNGTTSGDGIAEVNSKTDSFPESPIADATWKSMESAGCVFLPITGTRSGSGVSEHTSHGYYWSTTPYGTGKASCLHFQNNDLTAGGNKARSNGCSVRLVSTVSN